MIDEVLGTEMRTVGHGDLIPPARSAPDLEFALTQCESPR
jgi:hypothetical protein